MISQYELQQDLDLGQRVQIVTPVTTKAIMGQVKCIRQDYIVLETYEDETYIEAYGDPVPADTIIPYKEIALIITITKPPEDGSKNNKKEDNKEDSKESSEETPSEV